MTVTGRPITFDATVLFNVNPTAPNSSGPSCFNLLVGAAGGGTSATTTLHLLPGSYSFHSPCSSQTAHFPFTVDSTGTVACDPGLTFVNCDGSTVTVSGFPMTLDLTGLAGPNFNVNFHAAGGGQTCDLATLTLIPGTYELQIPASSVPPVVTFTVTNTGTLDYVCDPDLNSCSESCMSGRGTSLLTVLCGPLAPCGNQVTDSCEQCDDGNTTPGDGCDETCQIERFSCCDNPNITCNSDAACGGSDTCCLTHCDTGSDPPNCDGLGGSCADDAQCAPSSMCCAPVCGNGFPEPGEECDEGTDNGTPGSLCSSDCESRGRCVNDPAMPCVIDGDCTTGTCCGNLIITPPEACDDGNQIPDDGCANDCTLGSGVPACPRFVGAQVVQATVKKTKFLDKDVNQTIERWKSKGSVILITSQANRFDPEKQTVQARFSEKDGSGDRVDLWPNSPLVLPNECPPDVFCFERKGKQTRFKWIYKDKDEVINPGFRKCRFKQRDNEFKFVCDGKALATIAAPTDQLGPPADQTFLVRQEIIVDGLCMTVQLACEQNKSGKRYKCVPTLLP